MSMLAGPRRKQKVINLRAKNNLWSNDTNKFGQRMLEKMGWSSGKGLGAHENGIVEHVVAKYKNDDRGLGFEDRNDQWTKHEDDFNSLLANLSNSENQIENNAPSGVSLEVKSKKSKARIHYHKYTRGKDLSRYSEKELANIFGKKTFKEETIDKPLKDDVKTSEQVFTEKGSMDDYFKNKLASLKLKSKLFNTDKHNEEITEYGFQGFASTVTPEESESNINSNNEFQPFSFYATKPNNYIKSNDNLMSEEFTNETEQVIKKKKKKKSKSKDTISTQENCTELQENNELSEQITDNVVVPAEEKKRKKKKKLDAECDAEDNNYIKKNKKSRDHTELCQDQNDCIDNSIPKKKKKRKNKNE